MSVRIDDPPAAKALGGELERRRKAACLSRARSIREGAVELDEGTLLTDEHGLRTVSVYRFLRAPAIAIDRPRQDVTGFLSTRVPEHTSLPEAA